MALIKCPECGKEISDKALQCIHCGYPLNTLESKEPMKETLQNVPQANSKTRSQVTYSIRATTIEDASLLELNIELICQITGLTYEALMKHIQNLPSNLVSGLPFDEAAALKKQLFNLGLALVLLPSTAITPAKSPMMSTESGKSEDHSIIKCPRCGSTSITTGQRGWKLTTGFVGSSKTVNRCANCGHTWTPSYWTRNQ